jgi:hypothetical protein
VVTRDPISDTPSGSARRQSKPRRDLDDHRRLSGRGPRHHHPSRVL